MLFLLRHGATAANLERPYRLQGRGVDDPLAPEGVRQAERTRELLADYSLDFVYAGPLRRAMETAAIIAEPQGRKVIAVPALTECHVGRWEGKTWDAIERDDAGLLARFLENPAAQGYPDGETFADVHARVAPVLDELLRRHADQTILVVGHHVVNRVYLAGLLGLPPGQARRVKLDNCGVSVVSHDGEQTHLVTLNATLHLRAAA